MEQQIYNVSTTVLLIFFSLIWKMDSWANVIVKTIVILLAIAGLFINLRSFGFILRM